MPSLARADFFQKRVWVRVDFNVPRDAHGHLYEQRILAALPTLTFILAQKPRFIVLMTHWGRPKGDEAEWSTKALAPVLEKHLQHRITCLPLDFANALDVLYGEDTGLFMMENLRFLPGEEADDPELAQQWAAHADSIVMEAFSCAHRAHCSTHRFLLSGPEVFAGQLLHQEWQAINAFQKAAFSAKAAVIGGAKISTKIPLIQALLEEVSLLCIGGAMAHTLLYAQGKAMGRSLYEPEAIAIAKAILQQATARGVQLLLPVDVCAQLEHDPEKVYCFSVDALAEDACALDIGPKTAHAWAERLAMMPAVVLNGPLGKTEEALWQAGSRHVYRACQSLDKLRLVGGGDTLAMLQSLGLEEGFSHKSMAGGALLAALAHAPMPGLEWLDKQGGHNHAFSEFENNA